MAREISDLETADMRRRVEGLATKSDKIRELSAAGYERADIARFLGIRYQHVRNVLVQDENRSATRVSSTAKQPSNEIDYGVAWTKVGPGGRVVIPAQFRDALGLAEGDEVQVRLDENEVRIVPRDIAFRRVQEYVRKLVPPGVSLVEGLIEERKREAKMEDRGE